MKKITIIDYGSGNVLSAQKSFIKIAKDNNIDVDVVISKQLNDVKSSTHIVLPGQGAFSTCMHGLKKIGEMDTELFHEFFKAFSNESKCNLHFENLYGKNNHHIIESCFKAFAKSLRFAVEIDNRRKDSIPSSKGAL